MTTQFDLKLEHKKGRLETVMAALSRKKVKVITVAAMGCDGYARITMITNKHEKALQVFNELREEDKLLNFAPRTVIKSAVADDKKQLAAQLEKIEKISLEAVYMIPPRERMTNIALGIDAPIESVESALEGFENSEVVEFTIEIEEAEGSLYDLLFPIGKAGINVDAITALMCEQKDGEDKLWGRVKLTTSWKDGTQRIPAADDTEAILRRGNYNFDRKDIVSVWMPDQRVIPIADLLKRLREFNLTSLYVIPLLSTYAIYSPQDPKDIKKLRSALDPKKS
jgi:hypothetical protein